MLTFDATTSILIHPAKKILILFGLSLLLRVILVILLRTDEYFHYSKIAGAITLPILMILSLALVALPSATFWTRRDQISAVGAYLVPAVMINSVLRIVDFARLQSVCEGSDFYLFEKLCEDAGFHFVCAIPFLFFGALVLLIYHHQG